MKSVNNNKENWLIFIDDKEKCKNIKNELEESEKKNDSHMKVKIEDSEKGSEIEKIEGVLAVDASSKTDEEYQQIVLNERLNGHINVLITTSVLDNGVNLTGIHNIVISDMAKVKSLQMVGRARVERNGDKQAKKTLYIKKTKEKDVKARIDDLEKQRDAYHRYNLAYAYKNYPTYTDKPYEYAFLNKYYDGKEDDWKDAKHWFGRDRETPSKLYPNEIARSLAERLVPKYKSILEEMQRLAKEQNCAGHNYLQYQLSWFGKNMMKKTTLLLSAKARHIKN